MRRLGWLGFFLALLAVAGIPRSSLAGDDDSARPTRPQGTVDPYPSGSPSLATSTAGELERLRDAPRKVAGVSQGYAHTEPGCPRGDRENVIYVACPPYNLTGDGTTDALAALQAIIPQGSSGKVVVFPSGKDFLISGQWEIKGGGRHRIHFNGSSLRWGGANEAPGSCGDAGLPECTALLKITASESNEVTGLHLKPASDGHRPGYGVQVHSHPPLHARNAVTLTPRTTVIYLKGAYTTADINPLHVGFARSGTGHIQPGWGGTGFDSFTYTSIGTSEVECAVGYAYCFKGVSGIRFTHTLDGNGPQIWFMESPGLPAYNRIEVLTHAASSVAGVVNGSNGGDYACNTNDDPWNVDFNEWTLADTSTEATAPLYGYRHQGKATSFAKVTGGIAGRENDYALDCGNGVAIHARGFGGGRMADAPSFPDNHSIRVRQSLGVVSIMEGGDSELNRPFLKVDRGAYANITVAGHHFRPGSWYTGGSAGRYVESFIDFGGYGFLRLIGVTAGFGTSVKPVKLKMRGVGQAVLIEQDVQMKNVQYDIDAASRWIRDGNDYSLNRSQANVNVAHAAPIIMSTDPFGSVVACQEFRDRSSLGSSAAGQLWRLCHDYATQSFFVQPMTTKFGLRLRNDYTGGGTIPTVNERGADTDPTTYGFPGSAACGSGCKAIMGGHEAGMFLEFTYTGTDAAGFTGVSGAAGYALAGAPVIGSWKQQLRRDIVQQWTTTSTTVTQPLRIGDGSLGTPSLAFSSDTNTGLYHTASADQFVAVAGGTASVGFVANGFTLGGILDAPGFTRGVGVYLDPTDTVAWGSAGNVGAASRDYFATRPGTLSHVTKALTEGAATSVFEVASGANGHLGVTIDYTIVARDGTPDVQTRQGSVQLVAAQTTAGASPTCVVGTATETVAVSTGTLTVTWTCAAAANKITAQANAVSSLRQTTLEVRYQVRVNASAAHGAVTPR